jgi:hypothetical protein
VSAARDAICRTHSVCSRVFERRPFRTIENTSSNHAPTKAGVAPALSGRVFFSAGKLDAEEEAVIVTVAVLLVSSAPTAQVTPASVLETLQEKVTLLPERPLIGVKVSVDVALLPGVIVNVPGEALSEKSPGTVVKLKRLDQAPYTPFDEDKALTCQ